MKKVDYEKLIIENLAKSGQKHVRLKELADMVSRQSGAFNKHEFDRAVRMLSVRGRLAVNEKGAALAGIKLMRCEVVKLGRSFGFVSSVESGKEYFVAGRSLKGAMPSDIVLAKEIRGRGDSPEAEVVAVAEENFKRFTGDIVFDGGRFKVTPDPLPKYAMDILPSIPPDGAELHEGDKVLAEIVKRGEHHDEHKCEILNVYGSSQKASVCALSVLDMNGISVEFPAGVTAEAKLAGGASPAEAEIKSRLDLRSEAIFTIDSADTKDIDDAISVKRKDGGYELGVHIADVSHYVRPGSELDREAMRRGTSVYYADRVVPMLPKELSNGICSLNPCEDRLALSCLMDIDGSGEVTGFRFAKTVIRSRVKGVYSEINRLLEDFGTEELRSKYAEVMDSLALIKELAGKLEERKKLRGVPEISTSESRLIISDDVCVGVEKKERGESEEIIEDFMLLANECAAKLGKRNRLPFVYRIHEEPSEEKLSGLKTTLALLNIPFSANKAHWQPSDFSELLENAKGTRYDMIINSMTLRAMSKARYSIEPTGHYGLALADYTHFTSPIRRYPDLAVHRIISGFLGGMTAEECHKRYGDFAAQAAEQSTGAEIRAMSAERSCEDRYKAEYMKSMIGRCADGVISSVTGFGVFVSLPDTCEGLLHTDSLGYGEYYYDGAVSLKNMNTGEKYTIGDSIRIRVENADVSTGRVDFALADDMD